MNKLISFVFHLLACHPVKDLDLRALVLVDPCRRIFDSTHLVIHEWQCDTGNRDIRIGFPVYNLLKSDPLLYVA